MSQVFGEEQTQERYVGVNNQNAEAVDYSQNVMNGEIITGLKVNWKDGNIVSLSIALNCQPAPTIQGKEYLNSQEDFFNMDQGDLIVEVFGRASNYIHCLGIRTKNNKSKVWGNPCKGKAFSFYKEGSYIKAFKVRAGDYIEYILPIFGHPDFKNSFDWPVLQNLKHTEHVRQQTQGKDIHAFDDSKWLQSNPTKTIDKIAIRVKKDAIVGIHSIYRNSENKLISPGNHTADKAKEVDANNIQLSPGEHITTINMVHSQDHVSYIYLKTDKGRVEEFGDKTKGDKGHYFIAPKGKQIIAFSGEHDKNVLKRIIVHYDNID